MPGDAGQRIVIANNLTNQADQDGAGHSYISDLLLAGEDQQSNRQTQDGAWRYTHLATANAGTIVVPRPGRYGGIIINFPVASATITLYDGLSTADPVIGIITLPATLLQQGPIACVIAGIILTKGLFVVTTGTNFDVTVLWA